MKTEKFTRKPFPIDAVQVTAENMDEVAAWCQGEVLATDSAIAEGLNKEPERFIKVRVHHPMTERQTKAFVGDWVLYASKGYKVYTDKAFARSFEPVYKPKNPTPALLKSQPITQAVAEEIGASVETVMAVLSE